ncbi:MAG: HAD-IIIC family phosphatase [Ignavibacteriaceae bacterium]|nr:HAD-IIIC family phosphatase [Ignavibacteriaceae bacterium]
MNFYDLKSNLKKDYSGLKKVKVALLGDSATQLLSKALKGYGFEVGYNFDIWEADYDQIEMQTYDLESDLYQFQPEYVIIYHSSEKLLKKFYKLDNDSKTSFAERHIQDISNLYNTITSKIKCKVIYFNLVETDDSVFGNYANKTLSSYLYQVRKINYELMNLSQKHKNLFINDVASLHNNMGAAFCTDPKIYITTDLIFSLDFLPLVAKNITDIILSIAGSIKKCIILDLDNTLWGGIIGDDGLENIHIGDLGIGKAFTALQMWLKQLKQRGIILAVCSKNTESIAKEPFEMHPDMVLKLSDIAVFVANWDNKVQNINYIQSILNIGFDSMVFLDDNPFERNMVRTHIPDITVPELPEDPSEYLTFLRSCNLFETASYTPEDEQRTQQYQEEAQRSIVQKQCINEDEFLAGLNMHSTVKPFDKFSIPRVSQLTQRSNQFNLRTVRYTEEEITNIAVSGDYLTIDFTLEDKYGDYGLISVIILKKQSDSLFIDTWIMSCRVLKRGMEKFVLNQIVQQAKSFGAKQIIGEYLPTPKNAMVKGHYNDLGFIKCEGECNRWVLNVDSYSDYPVFISADSETIKELV